MNDDDDRAPIERQALAATAVPAATIALAERIDLDQVLALLRPKAIDLTKWLIALASDTDFEAQDAPDASLNIMTQILLAESPAAALSATAMENAQSLGVIQPGDCSPLLEIREAIPLPSSYEEGASTFAVVRAINTETGSPVTFSCGSKAAQMVLIKFIGEGWMPFRAVLSMRRKPTKNGFYPLNLQAGA